MEYHQEIFENENLPLFKIGIEYNDYVDDSDEIFNTMNRVLYNGEVDVDDLKEGTPLFDLYIENLIDNKPMPSKRELDKRTRIGELIFVKDYVRSDGTRVSGYYRTFPKKYYNSYLE